MMKPTVFIGSSSERIQTAEALKAGLVPYADATVWNEVGAFEQNPVLEGSMTLAVRVAADGRVDGTQVTGSLRDRDVFACVRNVASHMRFPAPGGRDCALIQVPFTFTPQR